MRVRPRAGRDRDLVDVPVADVLEERVAGLDGGPDLDQRQVAGRQHEPRLEVPAPRAGGPAMSSRQVVGGRALTRRTPPRRRPASRQRLAPALQPVGHAEGHVTQVDEEPAEAPRHLDGGAPDARPEVDRRRGR